MNRLLLGLMLGSAGLLAAAGLWAERILGPWLWAWGALAAQFVAQNVFAGETTTPDVDWQAIERGVVASEVPEESRDESSAGGSDKAKGKRGAQKGGTLYISADRVLKLSHRAKIPASRYVPASGQRPAGLQVAGVEGLGIGARDGDVLTKVAGVEVRSSAAVVSTVLKLRAQRAKAVSGEFWRGQQQWQIVFEMPYVEPLPKKETSGGTPEPGEVGAPAASGSNVSPPLPTVQ